MTNELLGSLISRVHQQLQTWAPSVWMPPWDYRAEHHWLPIDAIEQFVQRQGYDIKPATLGLWGFAPLYNITYDRIEVPARRCYAEPQHYYHNVFHELAHSTGPKLGRRMPGRSLWGTSPEYAKEECTAELTASALSHEFNVFDDGVSTFSTDYITAFLQEFQPEQRDTVLQAAASDATRALDYLMQRAAMPMFGEYLPRAA
jgi:antirestriction protein ArdC